MQTEVTIDHKLRELIKHTIRASMEQGIDPESIAERVFDQLEQQGMSNDAMYAVCPLLAGISKEVFDEVFESH